MIKRIGRHGLFLGIMAALPLQVGCATREARPSAAVPASTCATADATTAKTPTVTLPLGCTNRANLRAMVADPADLDHGRVLTPASGTHEALGVEAYNKGQVKALGADDQSGPTTTGAATPSTGGN
jgi:type IV pilus biogenesis protein CpaD/CtpE